MNELTKGQIEQLKDVGCTFKELGESMKYLSSASLEVSKATELIKMQMEIMEKFKRKQKMKTFKFWLEVVCWIILATVLVFTFFWGLSSIVYVFSPPY